MISVDLQNVQIQKNSQAHFIVGRLQQTSLIVSCSNPLDSETGASEFFQEDYSWIISRLPGNFATAGPSIEAPSSTIVWTVYCKHSFTRLGNVDVRLSLCVH